MLPIIKYSSIKIILSSQTIQEQAGGGQGATVLRRLSEVITFQSSGKRCGKLAKGTANCPGGGGEVSTAGLEGGGGGLPSWCSFQRVRLCGHFTRQFFVRQVHVH